MENAQLPENVLMLDSVPHDWLFPRVAAVVHHGGIGTTAAGLRAGVPATIVPFFADQPFWGKQLARAGVGTEPIPRKKLSAEGLAAALRQLTGDQQMQQRASEMGKRVRAEDGVGQAVQIINRQSFPAR
jgi:UDP:flavonoid glycosyltransferase YjiC (YdhE family)